MLKYLMKKTRGDAAESNTIALVILIPLIMGIFFSVIDVGAYFLNRSQIYGMAHNGARTVAIMGGNGTLIESTKLEAKYGMTHKETCGTLDRKPIDIANPASTRVAAPAAGPIAHYNSTAIECNIIKGIEESRGFINIEVDSVRCSPQQTKKVGDRTSCEIKWTYNGTPGSALSMINLFKENTTAASAESEVGMPGMVPRR